MFCPTIENTMAFHLLTSFPQSELGNDGRSTHMYCRLNISTGDWFFVNHSVAEKQSTVCLVLGERTNLGRHPKNNPSKGSLWRLTNGQLLTRVRPLQQEIGVDICLEMWCHLHREFIFSRAFFRTFLEGILNPFIVMMTSGQAERLFQIVREAKINNYEIPHGRALATLLYPTKKTIGKSQIRAATAFVKRLKKYGCIRKVGGRHFIDHERLVTVASSAAYVLKFRQICSNSTQSTTNKKEFHEWLLQNLPLGIDPSALEIIYSRAIKGRYITEDPTVPGALRVGEHLVEHLPYLELLVKEQG